MTGARGAEFGGSGAFGGAVDTKRPPGVPDGARLVTLAELRDRVAGEGGSLRLGPRGSYLRIWIEAWPLRFSAPVRVVLGGELSTTHSGRGFSLELKRLSSWECWAFTAPGSAERQFWIWTLDDERAERDLRRRRAARAEHERGQA